MSTYPKQLLAKQRIDAGDTTSSLSSSFLRIERISKLGRLGELLAEECLSAAGFTAIKNLNAGANFPYADIIATEGGQSYLIGVKARNEFRDVGSLNPTYNAIKINDAKNRELKRLGMSEAEITALMWAAVDKLAAPYGAIPAWIAIAMRPEQGTYSAYFGSAAMIRHRRSIPMLPADRIKYREFAPLGTRDVRITADLLNR